MFINTSEFKWYESEISDDSDLSGDVLSLNGTRLESDSQVLPNVTVNEALDGIVRFRKVFLSFENADNVEFNNVYAYIHTNNIIGGFIELLAGTHDDVLGDINKTSTGVAKATISQQVESGDTVIYAVLDDISVNGFVNGNFILFNDQYSEMLYDAVVTLDGLNLTVNLAANCYMTLEFDVGDSISSLLNLGDINPSCTYDLTSPQGGTFNVGFVDLYVLGTIFTDWTITLGANNTFSCTSPDVIGTFYGNTAVDFVIYNKNRSNSPYFIIRKDAWGDLVSEGNILVLSTVPSTKGIWIRHTILALSEDSDENLCRIGVIGSA